MKVYIVKVGGIEEWSEIKGVFKSKVNAIALAKKEFLKNLKGKPQKYVVSEVIDEDFEKSADQVYHISFNFKDEIVAHYIDWASVTEKELRK